MNSPVLSVQTLLRAGGDSERSVREQLLRHVLGCSRSFFYLQPQAVPEATQLARFQQLLQQWQQGRPLAYLLGECEFWSLTLQVDERVLVPRPDTECVVEQVLALGDGQRWRVADLGTGSGAIALALASSRPDWQVLATDAHADSLAVAQANAQRLQLPVQFRLGSWLQPLRAEAPFDCIVSNPPYIAEDDVHLSALQHEPRRALVAAEQGLADLRELAEHAISCVRPGGWLVLEHGYEQGSAVRALLQGVGWQQVRTGRDHGGNDRYTLGQAPLVPSVE